MKVEIYVEGAGNPELVRRCRRAFKIFFERAGLQGRLPAVIPCGGRDQAYGDFVNAPRDPDVRVILLVDSEERVTAPSKWDHVAQRQGDRWVRPAYAAEDDLHFMAQCMESWFLADRQALTAYFGPNFNENQLPRNPAIEEISKKDVARGLKTATAQSSKGEYHKGKHSFELLALLRPQNLSELRFASRFLASVEATTAG